MAVGFRWRWPALSRRRLSPACRGLVSPPRSSNRTCRFPVSGSPTGFTARHTVPTPSFEDMAIDERYHSKKYVISTGYNPKIFAGYLHRLDIQRDTAIVAIFGKITKENQAYNETQADSSLLSGTDLQETNLKVERHALLVLLRPGHSPVLPSYAAAMAFSRWAFSTYF